MKIDEFKSVNEGIGDFVSGMSGALIGDQATSAIKGMFGGAGTKTELANRLFLKDFISDAIASINNGIQSGIIDKTIETSFSSPSVSSPDSTSVSSSRTTAPASPSLSHGTSSPSSDAYSMMIGQIRKLNPVGTKKIPDRMLASLKNEIRNVRYNKDWAVSTGKKIMDLAKRGYDVSSVKQEWEATTALGKKQNTVQESSYQKLNAIFESIMNVSEQDTEATGIAQFVYDWFGIYMEGTNWSKYSETIKKLCKNVEVAFQQKKNWKQAITILGKAALTVPGSASAKGVENIKTSIQSSMPVTTDIAKQLTALKKTSPEAFNAVIKQVQTK